MNAFTWKKTQIPLEQKQQHKKNEINAYEVQEVDERKERIVKKTSEWCVL